LEICAALFSNDWKFRFCMGAIMRDRAFETRKPEAKLARAARFAYVRAP